MVKEIEYLTDKEYKRVFFDFCSFRQKIATELLKYRLKESQSVLDFAAGHGLLSFAINDIGYKGHIVDVGLINDLETYKRTIQIKNYNTKNIEYIVMDTSSLGFRDNSFEIIANFLGLEDINMTQGKEGVKTTLKQLSRILHRNGILEISIMLKGKEPSSIINWKLWKYIGLNSFFYSPKFYIKSLKKEGCRYQKKILLKTYKKMTIEQAKEEILFACKETPKIYSKYGVKAKEFQKVWKKFRDKVEKHGLGFYPIIMVLLFKKQ
ncbi:MAG: class I SAM-dependent methyltransferase [Promethearchaeota archaeon]